jgi:hypothetical protein
MPLLANDYMHARGWHLIISPEPYTIQDAFSYTLYRTHTHTISIYTLSRSLALSLSHTHNPLIPHADTCIQSRDRTRDIVILFHLPWTDAECNISKALARVALRILRITPRTRRKFVVRRFHVASAVLALR